MMLIRKGTGEDPLLIEKKTAQGLRRFCASKQCGKPIPAE